MTRLQYYAQITGLWWCGPTFVCEPTSCWLPKHVVCYNNEINLINFFQKLQHCIM